MARAWKIPGLSFHQDLKTCLGRILAVRFREMNSYKQGTIEGKDIEMLHSMRVSSRRLQAVLRIFRKCFPQKAYVVFYAELRTLIRALGEVRHYDVFIDMLEKKKKTMNGKDSRALELMIARQRLVHIQKRKVLLDTFKQIERKKLEESFTKLLETLSEERKYKNRKYRILPNKPLIDNLRILIPSMFDFFMRRKLRVIGHPRLKTDLHEMRKDGKPVRYIMELALPAFKPDFKKCYEELKNTVEMLGEIHDADVTLNELMTHLKELRMFNKTVTDIAEKFQTQGLKNYIIELKHKRENMFNDFSGKIVQWDKTRFRSRLLASMNVIEDQLILHSTAGI